MNRWLDSRKLGSIRLMDNWLVRLIMASYTHEKLKNELWLDGYMVF